MLYHPVVKHLFELFVENFVPALPVMILINSFNLFILSSIAEIGLKTKSLQRLWGCEEILV